MPVHQKFDKHNQMYYMQWGNHGAKYYYTSLASARRAYQKALAQGRAIEWRKHKKY